jgi:excisionase family DNA binding protein
MTTTLDDSPLFTLEAAAEKLTISVRQLRRLIDSGQISKTTIGVRGVRISQQMIDDYRAAHTACHATAAGR